VAGLSFDTGILIALERRDTRAWAWMRRATERGTPPVVSTAAVAEAWRGRRQPWLAQALRGCEVTPLSDALARSAGAACAATGAQSIDAVIAATAAAGGTPLLTADLDDMHRLTDHFRSLRVVAL
jgi:predicted nucleic acid-binding protein